MDSWQRVQHQWSKWRTLTRTMVLVTTWTFGFTVILLSPFIMTVIFQQISDQSRIGTATSAWGDVVVYDNHGPTTSIGNHHQLKPRTLDTTPVSRKGPQSERVGDIDEDGKVYLVMDLSSNRLFVNRGEATLYTAIASAGSGKVLYDPGDSSRRWIFKTPKGTFEIQNKLVNPVWIKPDWAFIEERQAVPLDQDSRLRPGALGAYALGFGNGYFIHGALYTNLLGTNNTHGCIQLGDEDLQYVFQTVPLGATLIIV